MTTGTKPPVRERVDFDEIIRAIQSGWKSLIDAIARAFPASTKATTPAPREVPSPLPKKPLTLEERRAIQRRFANLPGTHEAYLEARAARERVHRKAPTGDVQGGITPGRDG